MFKLKTIAAAAALSLVATGAIAGGWKLDSSISNVSFASIKNDAVGESHSFGNITGTVDKSGLVTVKLGLPSVQTNIDIRNERMIEHVFKDATVAKIKTNIDMEAMKTLKVGKSKTMETTGTLIFLGEEVEVDAKLFVMRLSEDKVMVSSDGMLMLHTDDIGATAGIDKLQELASLDSITRVSPVSLRLFFDAGS